LEILALKGVVKFVPKAIRKSQCFIIISRNPADCIERVYGEEKIMSRFKAGLFSGFWVLVLFVAVFGVILNVPVVCGSGTIIIRADGSIDPPDAPIITYDNVTYTLTDNITSTADGTVVERDNIIIDGAGYTLEGSGLGAGIYVGIYLADRFNVTVKNINIKHFDFGISLERSSSSSIIGNNITANTYYGIELGSSFNNIIGNNIENNWYGIYLGSSFNNIIGNNIENNGAGLLGVYSNFNNIIGNNIENNSGDGIYLESSNYNSIIGNNIENNSWDGIVLRGRSNYNSISGNNITANTYYGMLLLHSSDNNNISGNKFINDGLFVWYSYQNSVENNTVNGRPLVYLEGVSNYTVDDAGQVILVRSNNIKVQGLNLSQTDIGVQLIETSNSTISGNNIENNYYGILLLESSNYNSIIGNNITANNYCGIELSRSSNNNIIGNNIENNYYGILLLESSNYNSIIGNNITANNYCGIELSRSSNNNIIGNNIENNYYGILLLMSSNYNSIIGNNIENNGDGIYHNESSSNSIFHNNFVENQQQVSVGLFAYSNSWDDGYPSGGNYWSDYGGVDEKSGPNQDEPGSDGIGDTPYVINANNRDHYPFMRPLDLLPPTTTHDYDGLWHSTDFTITLTANDDMSGVAETYYKINNEPTKTVSADGQPLITTEGADNKLEYWSVDNAGNEELPHKIQTGIKLDKTAPTGSIIINNGDAYTTSTSAALTLTATDATSGVYQVRFSNDGIWDTEPWETPSPTKTWTLTVGDGTKTVYYQIKDNAGLISETYTDTIVLDTTIPNIETPTREPADNIQPDQPVKVSVNVTDAISQVKNVTLSYTINDGETWTDLPMNHTTSNVYEATIPSQQADTTVRFKIVAYDHAENTATLDGTEPYCTYQVIPEFPTAMILPLFIVLTLFAVIFRRKSKMRQTRFGG
jgi:parallel beta-helix repeat protein